MKKQLVFIPLLLVASLFMTFYVIDAQAASPAVSPAKSAATSPATSPVTSPGSSTAGKPNLAAPACSGFYGTFTATNWPGGKLTLTCPGKNRQRGKCVGGSQQLSPGEHFS